MIVIGLTGSIAMGKSTIAAQCELLGAKATSADAIVHRLMQPNGAAYEDVAKAFPKAVSKGIIDRKLLGGIVFNDDAKLKTLETILHPLVAREEKKFAMRAGALGAKIVVLDIPLLFEVGAENRVDMTLVATAPYLVQRQRALARANMSEEKFASILAKQMPDSEKRARADVVVHTGLGKACSMRQLRLLFDMIGECA